MENFINGEGMTVKRNSPFAGTMVPMKYYRKDKRVTSVMIEVNRRLYMDEVTGEKLPGFEAVHIFVLNLVRKGDRNFWRNLKAVSKTLHYFIGGVIYVRFFKTCCSF